LLIAASGALLVKARLRAVGQIPPASIARPEPSMDSKAPPLRIQGDYQVTPPSTRRRRQIIARAERREAQGQERTRQADLRRARTGDWGACERRAREALERNRARLLYS
jgi:hypothetical protein